MTESSTAGTAASSSDSVPRPRMSFPEPAPADVEMARCTLAEDGTIVAVNARWRAFARANGGAPADCGVGANYLATCERASGDRRVGAAEVAAGIRGVFAGVLPSFDSEYSCHAPTELRWFEVRVVPAALGVEVSHHDITVRKLAELEAVRQLLRDPLTDLPNEALLTDRLEQALADGSRAHRLVAVAVMSLDNLDQLRRNHGDVLVDTLLLEAVARLGRRMRDGDSLGRVGTDRLAVVLRDLAAVDEAQHLTGGLTDALAAPFRVDDIDISLMVSAGVSVDQWAQTAAELLDAAGLALQDARLRGDRRMHVVTPAPPAQASARVRTEASLRQAMYRDELVVHYQPVVDLLEGEVVGVEALVRWQHPTDGLLGPDLFIPVAEAGGLIVALGEWVLKAACEQAVAWRKDGLVLDMAVNLSPRQVAHPDLFSTVVRILRETGMDPRGLVFEVTESAVMEDAEVALRVLNKLSGLGVSLSIDDFGTGYSSLLYLKRYPISTLKVDRSFVGGLGVHEEDGAIVASLIGLAGAVGATCIAEGIETEAQYLQLRVLGSGYGQGWLFGRAVEAELVPELVVTIQDQMRQRLLTMPALGDPREQAGDARDEVAGQRDQAADHRDRVGDQRDQAGDLRDSAADRRDQKATERDVAAELRDEAAARRDRSAERLEGDTGVAFGSMDASAAARQAAADDRSRASQDRLAGADERHQAEHDRDTAQVDRGAGAGERTKAERDRDSAEADRGASAVQRSTTSEQLSVLGMAAARDRSQTGPPQQP